MLRELSVSQRQSYVCAGWKQISPLLEKQGLMAFTTTSPWGNWENKRGDSLIPKSG